MRGPPATKEAKPMPGGAVVRHLRCRHVEDAGTDNGCAKSHERKGKTH